jgi:hypothetical protein
MNRRRLDLSENVEIGNEVVLGSVIEGLDSVVVLGSDVAIWIDCCNCCNCRCSRCNWDVKGFDEIDEVQLVHWKVEDEA